MRMFTKNLNTRRLLSKKMQIWLVAKFHIYNTELLVIQTLLEYLILLEYLTTTIFRFHFFQLYLWKLYL